MNFRVFKYRNRLPMLVLVSALFAGGCGTLSFNPTQSMSITTEPSGATLVITDLRTGSELVDTRTPYTASLKRGAGFFKGAHYNLRFVHDGYVTRDVELVAKTSGWTILGNIIAPGGFFGLLIVDPITGGMWTLEPRESASEIDLAEGVTLTYDSNNLKVVLLNDLPEGLQAGLTPLAPAKPLNAQ